MANMLFANNCNTTLSSSLTNVATTMSVTSATGFPSPTGSQYFYCTLADAATQTTIEIVKVTAVSGTTFTIVRGQDGTSGTAFALGDVVSLRLVRASLNDFPKLDEANTFTSGDQSFAGNLVFSSTAQRITGDFTNATLTNRVAFQTSTTNGNTVIEVIPNGTNTTSQINLESDSAIANGTILSFATNNAGSATAGISAGIRGTGTYLPFTIYTGGSERLRVSTTGNISFGTTVTTNARLMSALVGGSIFDRAASFGNGNITANYQLVSVGANSTTITNGIGGNDSFLIAESGGVYGARNFGIGNTSNLDVYFITNATERMRLFASGGVSIGNTTDPGAGNLSVSGTINTKGYTVATLPTGVTGARAYVTNALAPAFGSTVSGGGTVTIPVFYNGSNWIVG
jgi:hypothetical protein